MLLDQLYFLLEECVSLLGVKCIIEDFNVMYVFFRYGS